MKPRVLFVDDEPQILETLADMWGHDYDVSTAPGGHVALATLEVWAPDVIVSDMRMPGMDGAAFLAAARARMPGAIRMLLTGQADLEAAAAAVNSGGIFKLLSKPCPFDIMAAALRAAVEEHRAQTYAAQLAARMVHAERLATLGTMSATLGHELGNALTVLGSAIHTVEDDAAAARRSSPETVDELVRGHARLVAQARSATSLARGADREHGELDVGQVLTQLAEALRHTGMLAHVTLELSAPPGLRVWGDRMELEQIVLNVVKNAIDALPAGTGRIAASVAAKADRVVLVIADDGCGIPADDLARVFEPYFTTKPADRGTGLGLPVVQRLVAAYRGKLELASTVGKGTTVTVSLPAMAADAAA